MLQLPMGESLDFSRGVGDALSSLAYQYQSIEDDDRPSSLADCLSSTGQLDPFKHSQYLQKQQELDEAYDDMMARFLLATEEQESSANDDNDEGVTRKRSRSSKSLRPFYLNDEGDVVFLTPTQTYWYLVYVKCPLENLEEPKFVKKFRR